MTVAATSAIRNRPLERQASRLPGVQPAFEGMNGLIAGIFENSDGGGAALPGLTKNDDRGGFIFGELVGLCLEVGETDTPGIAQRTLRGGNRRIADIDQHGFLLVKQGDGLCRSNGTGTRVMQHMPQQHAARQKRGTDQPEILQQKLLNHEYASTLEPRDAHIISASRQYISNLIMYKLVLMRHGESQWNLENRFTGWTDVDLTDKGRQEAYAAGKLLEAEGFRFDVAYTSVLRRAIRTLWTALDAMDLMWIPIVHSWRLNERHYGALQGLNKAETAARYGEEQVLVWRRAYAVAPDPLTEDDERHAARDPRYAALDATQLPRTECLRDTVQRVLPVWNETIAPAIKAGKQVLIAAHGNSLRALIKYLDGIGDDDIVNLNIPTARPIVYELDENLRPIRHYYLGNQDDIAQAMAAVAGQGKARA